MLFGIVKAPWCEDCDLIGEEIHEIMVELFRPGNMPARSIIAYITLIPKWKDLRPIILVNRLYKIILSKKKEFHE